MTYAPRCFLLLLSLGPASCSGGSGISDGADPSGSGADLSGSSADFSLASDDLSVITDDLSVALPDLSPPSGDFWTAPGLENASGSDLSFDLKAAPDLLTAGPPPANDKCAAATVLKLAENDVPIPHLDISATTARATHDLAGACDGSSGGDVFFSFTLTRKELVYADSFGASWDTALFFASSCSTAMASTTTAGDSVCNDDACGSAQSQIVALLGSGTYYLVLSGKGSGSATIHFDHAPVGRGAVGALAKGTTLRTGTTTATGSLFDCMGGGGEDSYWWTTCPANGSGAFSASTCNGATWDTIFALQIPRASVEYCADDNCGVQSTLAAAIPAGAGLQVFTVDGASSSAHGDYTATITRP